MNGGEIVALVLKEEQVKFLFTLCGGHISPVLVSAKQAGIRVIDTRHEVNAVFAADAVARLTGIPGVAAVTAGPGITNTITAVKNSFMAQTPLILLGGAAPTLLKGRGALQDIDQIALMKPIVKWAVAVRKKRDIYPTLKKAFLKAQQGVPGPVFVELPIDVLYEESIIRQGFSKLTSAPTTIKQRTTTWFINRHFNDLFRDESDPKGKQIKAVVKTHTTSQLGKAARMIAIAKRPVILVGSGAMMNPSLAGQLAEGLTILGIPTYLSGMARGLLGKESSLQYRHHRKEALREADVVLLAGVPCDFRLDYGRNINSRATLIAVNRSTTDLNKNRRPDVGIHADPMHFLIDFSGNLGNRHSGNWEPWKKVLSDREAKRETAISTETASTVQGINPVKLFLDLDKELSENAVIVADGGDFVGTSSYIVKPRKPLSWLDPGVFGTLGIGGGFALGAKLCSPDSEVFILYGDGSAAYSLMEFDTFVRHGLPVIAIIGNDASWSQIARDQIEMLKDDCGTVLASSDYEMIAHAYGARGKKVHTLEEFHTALGEARSSIKEGIPYIINAVLEKSDFRKGSLSM